MRSIIRHSYLAAVLTIAASLCSSTCLSAQDERAAVFTVKYISSDSVYINAGRNAGIQEGMLISVVNAQAAPGQADGARFRGEQHVAEL